MSTHSRLACAAAALCLCAPAVATADKKHNDPYTGGATYGAKYHSAGTASIRKVPLRLGMHGRSVRVLQQLINRIGIHIGTDGRFGHATWAALRRIEKRAGLPVDGVLSSSDLKVILKVVQQGGFKMPKRMPAPLPAGSQAKVMSNGLAAVPVDAPQVVKDIIAAGNRIASKPYVYGGGHGHWKDRGYDCSGSVSYALHGAGLLKVSRDSTGFESFGQAGAGKWVTIYANAGHAYMIVAGLRFDTSGAHPSRWQSAMRSPSGYVVRHPVGL